MAQKSSFTNNAFYKLGAGNVNKPLNTQGMITPNNFNPASTSALTVPMIPSLSSSFAQNPAITTQGMIPGAEAGYGSYATATPQSPAAPVTPQITPEVKTLGDAATPESSWGGKAWDYMTGGSGAQHKVGDIVNGKALSSLDVQNMEEARLAGARADDLNSFDWTGGLNTALAGWQALETNKNNKEMMSLYKGQLADARAETSRRNKTRSAWGTAMANAGTKTA